MRYAALASIWLLTAIQSVAAQDNRIALIIGNSDYDQNNRHTDVKDTPKDRLTDLPNGCSDAELIQSILIKLKWQDKNILFRCNASKKDIIELLEDFTQLYMSSTRPFGFIYYAGHGVQIGDSTYIFGVDTKIDIDNTISILKNHPNGHLFKGGVRLKADIVSTLGGPGNGSLFIVLDACRENPVAPLLRQRSIANVSAPRKIDETTPVPGIKYLFSTAAGKLASDGAGAGNSPFALIFAQELAKNAKADYLIRHVVDKVYSKTLESALPQMPDEAGTFRAPPPDACFQECDG